MGIIFYIITIWLVISVPASLIIGAFFRLSRHPQEVTASLFIQED